MVLTTSAVPGGGDASTGGATGAGRNGSQATTYGFHLRDPADLQVTCSVSRTDSEPQTLPTEDYVCNFAHGTTRGYLYWQATPTDCRMLMGAIPTAVTTQAWISITGAMAPLPGFSYEHRAITTITRPISTTADSISE